MFTPVTGPVRLRPRSVAAAAAAPALLNPILFTSARSAVSRNILGLSLPGCARAVTVPTSTNPNPSAPSPRVARASLSNPAASPTGPGNSRPSARTRSTGSRGPSQRPSTPAAGPVSLISQNPTPCAASAGTRRSTTR
jgi:hypothetical protein